MRPERGQETSLDYLLCSYPKYLPLGRLEQFRIAQEAQRLELSIPVVSGIPAQERKSDCPDEFEAQAQSHQMMRRSYA